MYPIGYSQSSATTLSARKTSAAFVAVFQRLNYIRATRVVRTERPRRSRYTRKERTDRMPPKIRELIADLEAAGFVDRGGKGSHRNFVHPKLDRPITVSGSTGSDAKHYQIRAVKTAIQETKK